MKKFLFIAALSFIICVNAGCSNNNNGTSSTPAQESSTTSTTASSTSANDTAESEPTEDYDALLEESLRVLTIENNVVTDCASFTSGIVIIPDGVTAIEANAFEGCTSITEIRIPSSVESISGNAFLNCTSLKTLEISEGLLELCDNVFDGCTNLKEVALPDSLVVIFDTVFGSSNVNLSYKGTIYTPEDAEALRSAVVQYDENGFLIGNGKLFAALPSVGGDVVIPNNVEKICMGAFHGNDITTLTIPGSVKEIEEWAFVECGFISEVTIEDGVTKIGDKAFISSPGYTYAVDLIHIPESLTQISEYALLDCKVCEYNGIEYRHYDKYEFGENHLYELYGILMPEYQDGMLIEDGVLKDVLYCRDSYYEPLAIPDGVTVIGDAAFSGDYFNIFYEIRLPKTLTEISDEAFMWSYLKSVELPENVKRIGDRAFRGCESLETVILNNNIEEIGENAFEYCEKASIVYKGKTYTIDDLDSLYSAING